MDRDTHRETQRQTGFYDIRWLYEDISKISRFRVLETACIGLNYVVIWEFTKQYSRDIVGFNFSLSFMIKIYFLLNSKLST